MLFIIFACFSRICNIYSEKRSTQHAVLDIVNQIQTNMDYKKYSCGIFIDLQKAFDTVNHSILLRKLQHYGVRGIVNDWFRSYLSNRIQTTQIGGKVSDKEATIIGVPQGSVLGPLLFLIYVNDIYKSSDKLQFYLFADDTNLVYADKDLKTLESILNCELLKVYDWLNSNKLSLNRKKTHFVIFRPYQKQLDYTVDLKIFDTDSNAYIPMERKDYVKYLGVLMDSSLTWKYHISHVASKISKTIGIISKLRHFIPRNTLVNIYRSLILPHLSYGIVVWGQAAKVHLDRILKLQKRVLRLIYFGDYTSHAIPFFLASNILPFEMLYFKSVSILMHDVYNNSTPLPISNLFTSSHDIHGYNTRFASNVNFYVAYSRLSKLNNSFSRVGPRIWNSIPGDLCKMRKNKFKKILHEIIFSILIEEGDYVDLTTLIKNLKNIKL